MEALAARMWPGFGLLTPLDEHSCMLEGRRMTYFQCHIGDPGT
jgi:hypothetical protein